MMCFVRGSMAGVSHMHSTGHKRLIVHYLTNAGQPVHGLSSSSS